MPIVRRIIINLSILLVAAFVTSQFLNPSIVYENRELSSNRVIIMFFSAMPEPVQNGIYWRHYRRGERSEHRLPFYANFQPFGYVVGVPWWAVGIAWATVAAPAWLLWGRKRSAKPAAFPVEVTGK